MENDSKEFTFLMAWLKTSYYIDIVIILLSIIGLVITGMLEPSYSYMNVPFLGFTGSFSSSFFGLLGSKYHMGELIKGNQGISFFLGMLDGFSIAVFFGSFTILMVLILSHFK